MSYYSIINKNFKLSLHDIKFLLLATLSVALVPWFVLQNVLLSMLLLTCMMPAMFWLYIYKYYVRFKYNTKPLKTAYRESSLMMMVLFTLFSLYVLQKYWVVNILFVNVVSCILVGCGLLLFCRLVYFINLNHMIPFARLLVVIFCVNVLAVALAVWANVAFGSFTFVMLVFACNCLLLLQDNWQLHSDVDAIILGCFVGCFLGVFIYCFFSVNFILHLSLAFGAFGFVVFSVLNLLSYLEQKVDERAYVDVYYNNINYGWVAFKTCSLLLATYVLSVFYIYKNLYISSILLAYLQPVSWLFVFVSLCGFVGYELLNNKEFGDIGKITCSLLPYDFIKLVEEQQCLQLQEIKEDKDNEKEHKDNNIETALGFVKLHSDHIEKFTIKNDTTEPWVRSEINFYNLYEKDEAVIEEKIIDDKTYFTYKQTRYKVENGWYLLKDLEQQLNYFNVFVLLERVFLQLNSLKDLGIIHADIKFDNIFYNIKTKKIKLIDFGVAVDLNHIKLKEFENLPVLSSTEIADLSKITKEQQEVLSQLQKSNYEDLKSNLNKDFQSFMIVCGENVLRRDYNRIIKDKADNLDNLELRDLKIYSAFGCLLVAVIGHVFNIVPLVILLALIVCIVLVFSEVGNFRVRSVQDFVTPEEFEQDINNCHSCCLFVSKAPEYGSKNTP